MRTSFPSILIPILRYSQLMFAFIRCSEGHPTRKRKIPGITSKWILNGTLSLFFPRHKKGKRIAHRASVSASEFPKQCFVCLITASSNSLRLSSYIARSSVSFPTTEVQAPESMIALGIESDFEVL